MNFTWSCVLVEHDLNITGLFSISDWTLVQELGTGTKSDTGTGAGTARFTARGSGNTSIKEGDDSSNCSRDDFKRYLEEFTGLINFLLGFIRFCGGFLDILFESADFFLFGSLKWVEWRTMLWEMAAEAEEEQEKLTLFMSLRITSTIFIFSSSLVWKENAGARERERGERALQRGINNWCSFYTWMIER